MIKELGKIGQIIPKDNLYEACKKGKIEQFHSVDLKIKVI